MSNTYKIIKFPTNPINGNSFAVIYPMEARSYHTGRISMPAWMPAGYSHCGTYATLEEAEARLAQALTW